MDRCPLEVLLPLAGDWTKTKEAYLALFPTNMSSDLAAAGKKLIPICGLMIRAPGEEQKRETTPLTGQPYLV